VRCMTDPYIIGDDGVQESGLTAAQESVSKHDSRT
jgi:hypothetical protein